MDFNTIKPYLIELLTLLVIAIGTPLLFSYLGIGKTVTLKDVLSLENVVGIIIVYGIFLILRYLYQTYMHRN